MPVIGCTNCPTAALLLALTVSVFVPDVPVAVIEIIPPAPVALVAEVNEKVVLVGVGEASIVTVVLNPA